MDIFTSNNIQNITIHKNIWNITRYTKFASIHTFQPSEILKKDNNFDLISNLTKMKSEILKLNLANPYGCSNVRATKSVHCKFYPW